MPPSFTGAVRDSLSNLAASLGAGKDKAAGDRFVLFDLDRGQIEAMVRGDWLARKVVDIVPYDMVREWRAWSGQRADVVRVEAAERRLGLRKAVQRAMVLGRLYGGGAILIGTGETDPAALARPLDPDTLPRGGVRFLHAVSRWQLSAPEIERDPLSPWFGEAKVYEVVAPERGALRLHPSRVVRFLGNPYPDPSLAASVWSDSVLQALFDAIHAVALTLAGATSLMHEAKVDVVTVPNLSEHLSSADTTAQLSARFAYAAAMKSINNLLLLGDGESWARQKVDFAGLPEMVRTFLQVAAGAADIPVTRLLGQSPAGLSATGDSDTRNYYDMIAARQELDLRPQLERLDRLILASEGIDPDASDLRVPAALADGRVDRRDGGAREGAGDADLRRAGALAHGRDGAARRSPGDRGRDLPECRGGVRRSGGCTGRRRQNGRCFSGRPGLTVLYDRAPRGEWPVDARRWFS